MADPIERLSSIFVRFPGIGPRQAQRFVQYLLRASPAIRRELMDSVRELGSSVQQCPTCKRFHSGASGPCSLCTKPERDSSLLAIIATDADLLALERSGTYRGRYFVLGGTVSFTSEKASHLRINDLVTSIPGRIEQGLKEVILAFPANPEGDATAIRVRDELSDLALAYDFTVSQLGRGLSTGSELEYADPDTLRFALNNRK